MRHRPVLRSGQRRHLQGPQAPGGVTGRRHLDHRRLPGLALRDRELAPRLEEAARRPAARPGRLPGQAGQHLGPVQRRDGLQQPAAVRVRRGGEHLARRAHLGDPARVQHRHVVGDLGDHRQVVADVDGRHPVGPAQVPDGLEHPALGSHVQAGGRLVEHDQLRPAGEGHGKPDPLLLPAGKLVRVGAEDAGHLGQADLGEHLGQPLGAGAVIALVVGEDLAELGADLQCRVQRAGRVLRHIGDLAAAQVLQVVR